MLISGNYCFIPQIFKWISFEEIAINFSHSFHWERKFWKYRRFNITKETIDNNFFSSWRFPRSLIPTQVMRNNKKSIIRKIFSVVISKIEWLGSSLSPVRSVVPKSFRKQFIISSCNSIYISPGNWYTTSDWK